jgi:hypothetical protein
VHEGAKDVERGKVTEILIHPAQEEVARLLRKESLFKNFQQGDDKGNSCLS